MTFDPNPRTVAPARAASHGEGAASAWAARWVARLPRGARVLDFAAGGGRNLPPLLARDAQVLAVDRDAQALATLDPRVRRIATDLEAAPWPFAAERFDAVLCCNYLFRPRLDLLAGLLDAGGLLVYETFAAGNAAYGKPSNPDFLLAPGELLALAHRARLVVLAYEDGHVRAPRPAMVQRLAAVRAPVDREAFALD